jgi:uncharacterized protein
MKMKWITEKTGKNSGKNRGILGAAGRSLKVFLTAGVLGIFLSGTAFAASGEDAYRMAEGTENYADVYDMADLFTDEEEQQLSGQAQTLSEKMKMEAVIVTTEENSDSAQVFADGFYTEGGFGTGSDHSGILFLIDMDNRELYISTTGQMIRYMTDSRIEDVLDDVYGYASDADYYGAASAFLADTETCYANGISKDQYNYDTETGKISRYHHLEWYEILLAIGIAAVCGGAAVASVLRSYSLHGEDKRMAANFKLSYRRDSRFTMGNILADALLTSYITQQVIASQKNNRPGAGGGSFSGGGRSSTHSYGGNSHGGGGRKF